MTEAIGHLVIILLAFAAGFLTGTSCGARQNDKWWREATRPFDKPITLDTEQSIERHGDCVTIITRCVPREVDDE